MNVVHFKDLAALERWFARHHAGASELWIGFHRKGTSGTGPSYLEAVEAALCWGWIDGVKKKVDDTTYTLRFSPRKAKSIWSDINTKRYAELEAAGRIRPPGRAAYERRSAARAGLYSFEQPEVAFDAKTLASFRKHARAWRWFEAQPPGWRRTMTWWVISAKREETRAARLAKLIASSARGERLA